MRSACPLESKSLPSAAKSLKEQRTDMTDEQAEQLLIAAQSIARSLELISATVEMQTVNEACAEEAPDVLRTLDSR